MKKSFLALSVIAAMLTSTFLSGCGASTQQSTKAPKTFVFAQGADPRGLDPAYIDDGESAKVICNVYEGLVRYKSDSTDIEPCLATNWKISPDGKEYTFNLRKNVKFQDGTPFNADAVKFSIDRQLPPQVKSDMPYASFTFDPNIVDKVVKVDDYTIKILLKQPYTPFLANLAMAPSAPIVSPTAVKKYGAKFTEHPVGTGPFTFVSWTKGQSVKLKKNEDYWGQKAKLDNLIFKITKENSVRASELMTGADDAIDGVDPNDIPKMKQSKMSIFTSKGMNINYIAFNCSRPPFNDPKLREAISYAINKPELVKYLYQGYSEAADSPLPSFIPGFDKDLKSYEYNPQKAKKMLQELGKTNLKIKIITYSNPRPYNPVNGQKLAESVQNYLSKVGVTADIQVYEWAEYKAKAGQGEGDMIFYGWGGDNGDADNFLSLFDSSQIKSTLNTAKYSNPQVDSLLLKAREVPNGNERNELYKQVQEITAKDAPWYPISCADNIAAYNPKVKNFRVHPTALIFFRDVDKD